MKLDRKLNLVIPIDTGDGRIYVHSVPVSSTIFDEHWLVLSKTFSLIMTQGLSVVAGPRIAYHALRDVSTKMSIWEGVKSSLVAEIARLTNVVLVMPDKGWQTFPLDTARSKGMIDDETFLEVLGQLVFFTLISTLNTRNQIPGMMASAGALWGSETTVLDSTAFANSLPMLTPDWQANTPSDSKIPS